jgi:hypothetical protein
MALADTQADAVIREASIPVKVTAKASTGTVAKGDLIGYSSGWLRALATVGSVVQAEAVAGEDALPGEEYTAFFGPVYVDGRITGGTPGSTLFGAEGADSGKVTETEPTTTNDANKRVGMVISATSYLLHPQANPTSLHA